MSFPIGQNNNPMITGLQNNFWVIYILKKMITLKSLYKIFMEFYLTAYKFILTDHLKNKNVFFICKMCSFKLKHHEA